MLSAMRLSDASSTHGSSRRGGRCRRAAAAASRSAVGAATTPGGRAAHRRGGCVAGRRGHRWRACTIDHGGMRRSLLVTHTRRAAAPRPSVGLSAVRRRRPARQLQRRTLRRRRRAPPRGAPQFTCGRISGMNAPPSCARAARVARPRGAAVGRSVTRRVDAATLQAFLDHHLWGPTQARFRYGLFERSSDELVAVASFSPRRPWSVTASGAARTNSFGTARGGARRWRVASRS